MQPFIGTAEQGAAEWWRLLGKYAPGCRVVTVRRPVVEVVEELIRLGLPSGDRPRLMGSLRRTEFKLNQVEKRLEGVISIKYEDLGDREFCRIVFEHCLLMPFDERWWEYWRKTAVEVDLSAQMRYWISHIKQIARMKVEARHRIMVDLTAKPSHSLDGLVIQEERFETAFPDAQRLFEQSSNAIGEPPDEWTRHNIPLMASMDDQGVLQIMTARANGKMFGYLMSIVGKPIDTTTAMTATQSIFFASKEWPGAGLRLQRASLAALKAKGVETVYMRSGLGPGSRVETLYKRLGAEPEGKLFRIKLGD